MGLLINNWILFNNMYNYHCFLIFDFTQLDLIFMLSIEVKEYKFISLYHFFIIIFIIRICKHSLHIFKSRRIYNKIQF